MDAIEIRDELNRVLASRCFRSRRVMKKFLSYIVEATLAGELHLLTQQMIAINALGQSKNFADLENPLVRVNAGRLRKQLEEYYATEGYFNPLRIKLPLGTYQPIFTTHVYNYPVVYENKSPSLSLGPSLICIPRNFTSENNNWAFIACLGRDYVTALSKFSFCQVLFIDETAAQQAQWPNDLHTKHHADFGLFFDLYKNEQIFSLKCSLIHSLTTEIVWAHSMPLGNKYPSDLEVQLIFRRIANDTVSFESGLALDYWSRYLINLGKPIPPQYQLIIAARRFAWDISLEKFKTYALICEERLNKFPNDTTALIAYADCCRVEYLLKYGLITQLPEKLKFLACCLQQQAPQNAYSQLFTGFAYMLTGDHPAAIACAEKAQELNPLDTHLNILTGMIYMALDKWELGANYVQACIKDSPIHPDWYHIPLCVYHYHVGQYFEALQAAKHVKLKHLWGSMLRAALNSFNDEAEKNSREYQNLLTEHPDWETKQLSLTEGFTRKSYIAINKIWTHLPKKK